MKGVIILDLCIMYLGWFILGIFFERYGVNYFLYEKGKGKLEFRMFLNRDKRVVICGYFIV